MFFAGCFSLFWLCCFFVGNQYVMNKLYFVQTDRKTTSCSFAYFEGGSEFRIVSSLCRYVAEQCNRM